MYVYHYHPATGEYLGASPAHPSPLEPGKYLIPAYATDTPPPDVRENAVAVFDDGVWTVVPDYRGTVYYDVEGNRYEITEIGEVIPDGVLFEPPDPAPTLEQAWELLRDERNARLAACDWTQLPDVPLTEEQRAAWQQYRQALRDVPQQPGAPWDVTWPEPPGPVA